MANPPPFPFSDLHFNGALTSLVQEVVVGNDVWPSDADDVSDASVDKSLQLVDVSLGSSPCFGAIQQERLDVRVEDSDLVVEGEDLRVPNGVEGVVCMSGLVDPALDVFFCSSMLTTLPRWTNFLTSFRSSSWSVIGSSFLLFGVLFLVDIEACLPQLLQRGGTASPVHPGVCVRGG